MTTERSTGFDMDPFFGTARDRRAAVIFADQEKAASRAQRLASQSSSFTEPEERIRIWEKLHELSLPLLAEHKLLYVIAAQTDLDVQALQQEQRRRVVARRAVSVPDS